MLILKIAFRYLLALRKASTVQILSWLSFTGIFLGSLAMLLVLSAFNGFEGLLREMYHFQDPDLKVEAIKGRFFDLGKDKLGAIRKLESVKAVFEVLKDKASVQYGDGQMVVELVGVDPEMVKVSRLDTAVRSGSFQLEDNEGSKALVSIGIQQALSLSLRDAFGYLKLAYPKRKKILKPGSGKIFSTLAIRAGGIVQMDENRIYIPINEARSLMDKKNGMNHLEVFIKEGSDSGKAQEDISSILGEGFLVKDEQQQHADLYKVMMIEKLFVFLALGFIILISTFNLFVSSTMLVLDKQKDIRILAAIGLPPGRASDIIRLTGGIITLTGMAMGLSGGLLLCWVQQKFGLIPLGMATTLVRDYPVETRWGDLLAIAAWVLASGFIAMQVPGSRARKIAEGRLAESTT